jgi:hypothetical protein
MNIRFCRFKIHWITIFGANSSRLVNRRQREPSQALKLLQQETESVLPVTLCGNMRLVIDHMENSG